MSSNLNQMPPPATKVGGVRTCQPFRHPKQDDSLTPQTNVESALSTQSQQERLEDALGLPHDDPTPSVHDAAEHPKANASTYLPPEPKNIPHANNNRGNSHGHNHIIQQVGGAYGSQRH